MDTIIYHGNCVDGWCAAFIAAKKYPDAQRVPAIFGVPIDDGVVKDKKVLVLDFSWPRAEVMRLHALSASLTIIDHHKTAEKELEGLTFCVFDMARSGAQLAYDSMIARPWGSFVRPWYIDYVADRDLWTWKLPKSKEVSAYLMTLPHTVEAWNTLEANIPVDEAARLGLGCLAYVGHYVEKMCEQAYAGHWYGHKLSIVNAPYLNISELGHELCKRGAEIALGWFVRADGRIQFGLRSIGDLDVSNYAKQMGGGGHRNAAGFELATPVGLSFLKDITDV